MDVARALREAVNAAGWSPAKVAAEAGVSENAARKWLNGDAIPSGDTLLTIMQKLPAFAESMGFKAVRRAA